MLPHTTSAVSAFPEDECPVVSLRFASKTGVGTTGLFRCSNIGDTVEFNGDGTGIPKGSSHHFRERRAAEASWWCVSASSRPCITYDNRGRLGIPKREREHEREARRGNDATGNRNTTGEDPTHRGPAQRGGPRRGLTTGGEGHTGDPNRTHTDNNVQFDDGGTGIPTGNSQRFDKRSAAEASSCRFSALASG